MRLSRGRVAELEKQVEDLQFADDARAAWRYDTGVMRDLAERARHAAAIRGIDLDNPAERVTAEEWLDAHRADQLAEDAHREITELDIEDELEDLTEMQAAARQDSERRARPADSTSGVVGRATLLLSTIEHGHDDDPYLKASDDARREDLARWAGDDSRDTDGRPDEPDLGRGR